QVGVFDNFFELGIDSILIIQIVSRGRQAGLRLDPGLLFQHQTIAALARAIADNGPDHSETAAEPIVPGSLLPGRDWEKLAGDGQAIEDAYPLSPVQQGMLYHTLAAPSSGVYIEQFTCLLRGDLDLDAFEASWRTLLTRHAALRTSIEGAHSDRPAQVVRRVVDLPLEHQDWRTDSPSIQAERLATFLKADRIRGFDLSRAPLLRLALLREADDAARLVWSHHHIVMDGWCMPVLMMEFLELYDAERSGLEPSLPTRRPFRDYIAWLQGQNFDQAEAFWRLNLSGIRTPTPLGIDREDLSHRGDEPPPHEERQMFLSAEATDGLRTLAKGNQITLNTTVQGAWAVLLSRYSGRNEVVFGVASAGRPSDLTDSDEMIGLFINTLPMRVAVSDEAELAPWLRQFQAGQAELRRLEATPLVQIQGWSEIPRGQPLFESLFIFENFPVDATLASRAGRLGVEAVRFLDQTNYPLNIMAVPGAQLFIKVGYDPRRFEADVIDRLLGHLRTLL
ncbi:MAG: condensation domain-containing protein, partial [Isosphaeraceae bacterium]